MSLRKHQSAFASDYAKLIEYAYMHGYELTLGEVHRPSLLQKLYVKLGKSWTQNSQHKLKLAGDLNLFKDGRYLSDTRDHKFLGRYWERLSPYNVWGGRFRDGNHYERRHDVKRINRLRGRYKDDI